MRIVKLSEKIFPELEDVMEFFKNSLPNWNPPGKFRITDGRIARDGLQPGEEVLFSYSGIIRYIARSATGCRKNEDEYQSEYPFYFLVEMNTLQSIEISLRDVEQRYHHETGETKSLVQTQGWPKIENRIFANNLWESLT